MICCICAASWAPSDVLAKKGKKKSKAEASAETEAPEIALSDTELTLEVGAAHTLQVLGLDPEMKVLWASSKENVARVSKSGKVKALRPGKTKIRATYGTGKKLACIIKVPEVSLNKTELSLVKGKKKTLKIKGSSAKAKWKSGDTGVATVDEDGVVRATGYGKTKIKVKIGAVVMSCKIRVWDPVIDKEEVYLLKGDSVRVKGARCGGNIKWSVADSSIAAVSSAGVVSAKKEGKTKLRMKANGVVVSCPITVATARLSASEWSMMTGEKKKIKVTGSARKGTWTSSDPERLSVSSKGVCKAILCGEARITYTVGDSSRSCHFLIGDSAAAEAYGQDLVQRHTGISSLRNEALGSDSAYRFMQGSCTDGKYGYFILSDKFYRPYCALIKVRLSDWKIVDKHTGMKLYHGNDMAYDSRRGRLMVVHGDGDQTGISFVDPKTLEIEDSVHLDSRVYGLAYDSIRDRYITAVTGKDKVEVRDSDWNILYTFKHVGKNGYTRQSLDCDKGNIYLLQSYMNKGMTRVLVYNRQGNYRLTIYISGYREAESLFHVGDRYVVTYNSTSYGGGTIYETALRRFYQIRMVPGEGDGKNVIRMMANGEKVQLPALRFTCGGREFLGWRAYRCSDEKNLYRNPETGKKKWYRSGSQPSGWKLYLIPDEKTLKSLSDKAGDCITLTAIWE